MAEYSPGKNVTPSILRYASYNQKLWMHHRLKGATYPPS